MNEISKREDSLFEHVSKLIDEARKHVKTTIDTTMVYTYYGVGKYIVEDEQQGYARAAYGKTVLKRLSVRLTEKYGKGWSYSNLRQIRQFYMVYSDLTDSVCQIHDRNGRQCLSNSQATKLHQLEKGNTVALKFTLSWSHYLILMRIANQNERNFYEIECYKQNWSVRQLQRQYNSSLYERLALSRNKDANIYASAYQLYLPDKALLQAKVKEWIAEFEENEELMKHESNE